MYPLCAYLKPYCFTLNRVIQIISKHNNTLKLGCISGRRHSVYLGSMKYVGYCVVRGSEEPPQDGILL